MIKKYNIDLNDYYWSYEIIKLANFVNIRFNKRVPNHFEKNKLRSQPRLSYNLEKFYLTNKNLWYIQKKNNIKINYRFKQKKKLIVNNITNKLINSKLND